MNSRSVLTILLASSGLTAGVAHAQTSSGAAAAVEEVVVTAQRREERLMDVPLSVTAVSGQQLEAAGITATNELSQLTPGLTALSQGYAFQPSIRGIGTTSTNAGDETNVALYIDNVYIPFMLGNAFNLKGVERVEVLKGPQGTLFGRNATGGAIRIVTRNPSARPTFEASADYGTVLQSQEYSVYASAPLTDVVAGSLEYYNYHDDGYVENINPALADDRIGRKRQLTARGKLRWEPADDAALILAADYTRNWSSLPFVSSPLPGFANGPILAFKNVRGVVLPDTEADPYTTSATFESSNASNSTGVSLTGQFEAYRHNLTGVAAYRQFWTDAKLDTDRTNLPISTSSPSQSGEVTSYELDAASDFEGRFNYVGGAFFYWANNFANNNESYSAPVSAVGPDGLRTVTGPMALISRTTGKVATRSWALFGEGVYDFTDAFSVILGYRYTWERKRFAGRNDITRASIGAEDSWQNSSVRATARYEFPSGGNVYATYSTGFKSGAFNAVAIVVVPQVAQPEEVQAFEVGVKAPLGPVELRAAAYHYKYDDIQLQLNNNSRPLQGTSILFNAAAAEITGAELEMDWRVTPDLTLQGGLSWIPKADYTSFPEGIDFVPNAGGLGAQARPTDLSGTRMMRTPEFTANLGVNYRRELAGGELRLSGNYSYNSGFLWVIGGAVEEPSYQLINGRIAWTDPSDRFTLSLWGRNLADEVYYSTTAVNTGAFTGTPGEPREIGLGLAVAF